MFPIRDHNPSQRVPYVTYALVAANVVIFLSYLPISDNPVALGAFFGMWAMQPIELSMGTQFHTLVTSMFLHAGFMHLAGNMLFLWIFGDNLEDQLGHWTYLGYYLACGVGAGLCQWVVDPNSVIPMVGASGAIAGVMGGYLLLYPKARVDVLLIFIVFFKVIPVPAWIVLGIWFGLQLFNGLAMDVAGGGVAYWAHAGGFVVGMALCFPLFQKMGGTQYWRRTEGHPPHPETQYRRSAIPRIRRTK